ncbi:MAG: hypothetical protein IPK13_01170 [Deltaproteobacteria bacterium]|nr:hypothetical protein [Deltaproteobacteria bacterium]
MALTAGDHFNCALLDSQEVYCWGSNEAEAGDGVVGALGAGTSLSESTLPLRVCEPNPSTTCEAVPSCSRALEDAVAISAKQSHACAARADGSVVCWGEALSWGIGAGSVRTTDYCAPVQVCTDGVDANCPTPLANLAVRRCDLLEVNVVENP